jgi:UDP-glucose 4-epimerase
MCDIRDPALLSQLLTVHTNVTVFHSAGIKHVYESVDQPICYFDKNMLGSCMLF